MMQNKVYSAEPVMQGEVQLDTLIYLSKVFIKHTHFPLKKHQSITSFSKSLSFNSFVIFEL